MGVLYGTFGSNRGLSTADLRALKARLPGRLVRSTLMSFQQGGPMIDEKLAEHPMDDMEAFYRVSGKQADTVSEAAPASDQGEKLVARRMPGKEVYTVGETEDVPREAGLDDFAEYLNHREMSGKRDAKALKKFNRFGYVGAMQMGTAALEEVGLLKPGTDKKKRARSLSQKDEIMKADNWVGGEEARDAWMSSWDQQKESAVKLGMKNRERLAETFNEKGITNVTDQLAYMVAAHLGGAYSVKKALKGGDERKDGNGVGIWNYRDGFKNWFAGQGLEAIKKRLPNEPEINYI